MVRVDTTKYEWAYGKRPRGRGNWAFEIKDGVYWFESNYGLAKEQAVRHAKILGAHEVVLLP